MTPVVLDGVTVTGAARSTQLLTVRHTGGHHAHVTLWERGAVDDEWLQVWDTPGRIGEGGLIAGTERTEGTQATPTGTYALTASFGTHRRSRGWRLDYRRIGPRDYWVGDNASPHYNRWRNARQGEFRHRLSGRQPNVSERLADYPVAYEFAMVIDFNPEQRRHHGFAIFLHVQGRAGTGGCVAVPREVMRLLMGRLRPERRPVIAIGPETGEGQA